MRYHGVKNDWSVKVSLDEKGLKYHSVTMTL